MIRWCIEIFFELYPWLRPPCSRFKKKVVDFLKGLFEPVLTDELLRRLNQNKFGIKYQVKKDEQGHFKVIPQDDSTCKNDISKTVSKFKADMLRIYNCEEDISIKPSITAEKAKSLFLLGYRFSKAWVYMHDPDNRSRWLLFRKYHMEKTSDIYIENGRTKATGAWGYCASYCDFRDMTDAFFPYAAPNKIEIAITICTDLLKPPNLEHAKQQFDYLMKQEDAILIDILISAQQK